MEVITNFNIQAEKNMHRRATISSLYEKNVICVDKNSSIGDAAKLMRKKHVGSVVIVNREKNKSVPIGILTDRDLIVKAIAQDVPLESISVSDIMAPTIALAHEGDGVYDMIKVMKENAVARLPVVNFQNELIGIITARKIIQLISKELSDLADLPSMQQHKEKQLE